MNTTADTYEMSVTGLSLENNSILRLSHRLSSLGTEEDVFLLLHENLLLHYQGFGSSVFKILCNVFPPANTFSS